MNVRDEQGNITGILFLGVHHIQAVNIDGNSEVTSITWVAEGLSVKKRMYLRGMSLP